MHYVRIRDNVEFLDVATPILEISRSYKTKEIPIPHASIGVVKSQLNFSALLMWKRN